MQERRHYWNQQAECYASDLDDGKYGRFLDLYEQECWHYIEPVLWELGEGTILEAGCGTGRWVLRLAPAGYRLVLCDLSPQMIAHAREKITRLGLADRVLGYHVLDICDMHALPTGSFDLILALGGLLSLCGDPRSAVREFQRLVRPGGYVICDAANRYRTALDLFLNGETDQVAEVLDTGQFSRPDGLTDHRFSPQELGDLLEMCGLQVIQNVGVCPFFSYLPRQEQVSILDDEQVYRTMQEIAARHAAEPSVVGLSGRLLVVGRKG